MTHPEFEKWASEAKAMTEDKTSLTNGLYWANYKNQSLFWISAFARLVKEEAKTPERQRYASPIAATFNGICKRFGLE